MYPARTRRCGAPREFALTSTTVARARVAVDDDAVPSRRRLPTGRVGVSLVVLCTIGAAALRLYRLRYGYAHGVVAYDDGVYLGSALRLTEGNLPYRDYVFVHPPVITVLLAPLALLAKAIGTAQAMGLAKILTGLAGAASVPLTARLLWHRGLLVVAPACGLVAVHDDAVAAGYGLLLEPWVVLFALIGAVLVFRGDQPADGRRLWWGGAVFGIACATKIWAFALVLAVVLVLLPARRRVLRYLSGVAAGFLVPVLPFAVFAPGAFVHQVFTVQVLRSSGERTSATYRLLHLFSIGPPNQDLPVAGRGWLVASALLLVAGLIALWVRFARGSAPLERFAVIAALLVVAMLFVPGSFYWHYAAFAIPFLAMAAALPLARLGRGVPAAGWAAVLAVCVAALTFTMVHRNLHGHQLHDDYAQVAAAVPAGSCVVTTMASSTIADERFFSSRPDCPVLIDPFGTALAYADGRSPSVATLRTPALVRLWADAYRRADFLYLVRRETPTVPLDAGLARYLRTHFHLVERVGLHGTLYARN